MNSEGTKANPSILPYKDVKETQIISGSKMSPGDYKPRLNGKRHSSGVTNHYDIYSKSYLQPKSATGGFKYY